MKKADVVVATMGDKTLTNAQLQIYYRMQVMDVLNSDFDFEDKGEARSYFLALRQLFIDWNYLAGGTPEFTAKQQEIVSKIAEKRHHA